MRSLNRTTITFTFTFAVAPLLLGGCVGDDQGSSSDSAASASTSESSSTTAVTSGSESATQGTSEGSTEGTSDGTSVGTTSSGTDGTTDGTTEGTTEGTTTGGGLCDPAEGVSFAFQLLPEAQDHKDFEVDYLCTVVEISPSKQGGVALEMSCTDGDELVAPNPILEVKAEPATELVAFAEGMGIRLIYGEVYPWWTERWVRIEAVGSGDLLLAGVDGSSLSPNDKADVFAPYAVNFGDGLCAPMSVGCGDQERLLMNFEGEGGEWELVDDSFDIIAGDPGLSTWIDSATAYVGMIDCSDTPQRWFRLGMVFDGQE